MKRRMLALLTAMLLILGAPLQVLAATHDVSDFEGVQNAFMTDTDAEVTVNLTDSITWEYTLGVNEGQNYTVNGNGNDISGTVGFYGDGDVTVNSDIVDGGLVAVDRADVTVNGDISGDGGIYVYDSSATVNGDVSTTAGVNASDATVVIDGNVEAGIYVNAYNSDVSISGNVTTDNVSAYEDGNLTIEGNVTALNTVAVNSDLVIDGNVDSSLYAEDATVTVNGDVNGNYVNGLDADMTIQGDVEAQSILADNSTLTIEGNATVSDVAVWNSDLTVDGDVDASVYAESSSVTINGDVIGEYVSGYGSDMTINGDVNNDQGLFAEESTVNVSGDVTASQGDALTSIGSTVVIGGNVVGGSDITTVDGYNYSGMGVIAIGGTVTVEGNVSSGDIHQTPAYCQPAVYADNATVKIGGNVTGGSVILASEPADDAVMQGGIGVAVFGSAVVEVAGNLTGGSIPAGYVSEENGICGVAVYYSEDDSNPFTGKVTVHGFLADGNSGYGTKNAAPVVTISPVSGSADTKISLDVSVSGNEVVIKELKADELEALLDALKKTIKENDEGVTIDISACKDADTIRIPVELLKAIIENFGILEIIFDGGVVTIDAAAFEKLAAENNFVTISLK